MGVIHVPAHGYVQVKVKVPDEMRQEVRLRGVLLDRATMQGEKEGRLLSECLLHHVDEFDIFDIFLPVDDNCFTFELFAQTSQEVGEEAEDKPFAIVCMYLLECRSEFIRSEKPCDYEPPFPRCCRYYGPLPVAYSLQIKRTWPQNSIVFCDVRGEARVSITLPRNDSLQSFVQFAQDLYDAVSDLGQPLAGRCMQSVKSTASTTTISFCLRVPDNGNFALLLYVKYDPCADHFEPLANFLVVSRKLKSGKTQPSYPTLPSMHVGAVQPDFDDLGLELSAIFPLGKNNLADETEGWIELDDVTGEAMVVFNHAKPVVFKAQVSEAPDQVEFAIEPLGNRTRIIMRCITDGRQSDSIFTSLMQMSLFTADTSASEVEVTNPELDGAVPETVPNVPASNKASSYSKHFAVQIFAGLPMRTRLVYNFLVLLVQASQPGPQLPHCPTSSWGAFNLRFTQFGAQVAGFDNSTSWSRRRFHTSGDDEPRLPCRVYSGGADLCMRVALESPIPVKVMLQCVSNEEGWTNTAWCTTKIDRYCLVQKLTLHECVVLTRFPNRGNYLLTLYGGEPDSFGKQVAIEQLQQLYHAHIVAESASACTKAFPATFAGWTAVLRCLEQPLVRELKPNVAFEVSLYLADVAHDKNRRCEEKSFSNVMLLVNQEGVEHSSVTGCNYQWKHNIGVCSQHVVIVAKQDEGDLRMLLQFDVSA